MFTQSGATLFSTTTAPGVWPVAGTTIVSRLVSTPHTVQYVTLSQLPVAVQVGSTLFSTTEPGVWPVASTTTVSRLVSTPHTLQYVTLS